MKYTDIIEKVGEILGYELDSEILYFDEMFYCWVLDGIWDGEGYIVFQGGDYGWEIQEGLNPIWGRLILKKLILIID